MDICAEVKKKNELRGLSDKYVLSEIESMSKKNNFPSNLTLKEAKELVKMVRAELRLKVARFRGLADKEGLNLANERDVLSLIKKHSSTRERIEFYPELIKNISALNPGVILDLGCGINPLALGKIAPRYEAYDIDELSLKIVFDYFKSNNILGNVHEEDITKCEKFPKADVVLLFKILDVIEKNKHKKAENLILKLNSRSIIISFSTKTLSGAPMNHPQRGWIERLLKRLGYSFYTLKFKNEIFYFASK